MRSKKFSVVGVVLACVLAFTLFCPTAWGGTGRPGAPADKQKGGAAPGRSTAGGATTETGAGGMGVAGTDTGGTSAGVAGAEGTGAGVAGTGVAGTGVAGTGVAPRGVGVAPQDVYTARTADGVDLALRRYRPDPCSPLRVGAQPVILTPGLACNFEFFDVHTPQGEAWGEELPENLAPWAVGDPYIQADPMKYYSLAYYLWKMGFDPWLANYRGQGRDEVRSGGPSGYAIDELGIYDMPAIITKVREVTGRKPVWVGHSMGGVMSYIYLEGARFENMADANSRVVSDPALVAERNNGRGKQALRGLISLDGPSVPGGSVPAWFEPVVWTLLYFSFYLDLRPITANLGGLAAYPAMALERLLYQIWAGFGNPDLGLANYLLSINPDNLDENLSRFFFTYAADGLSTRTVAQFADAVINRKMREDYRNGPNNWWRWAPPEPREGDGYYYYSDHFDKISLPALILVDAARDITNPEDVRYVYERKTRNRKDRCYVIPGTAHADIVLGLNAPTELFPKIGAWLQSL